ncbi:MAG: hypothetical protein ABIQ09_18165 [Jatrophihabitantaceae bacterium]
MSAGLSDLTSQVAERLGVRVLRTMARGGSGARTALTESDAGGLAVLKIVTARPNVVDGHDLESFRMKARQVQHLRQTVPGIARYYPPLLASLDAADWSATLTDYAPGLDLVALAARDGSRRAHDALRVVWSRLSAQGYAATSQPASADHWLRDFCDRLERRRPLLEGNVPAVLLSAGVVTVNGRTIAGFDGAVAAARALAWVFEDSLVAAPVHGDLNLRNIVIGDQADDAGRRAGAHPSFSLLDPRGTLTMWDPVYDLAKVLFTLTVFDDVMESGALIGRGSDGEFTVAVRAPRHQAWLRLLTPDLEQMLSEAGVTGELAVPRLFLAHSTHVLAEAACRISDIGQPPADRRESAVALLLFGLLLIADLAQAFGSGRRLRAADHLTLLEPRA